MENYNQKPSRFKSSQALKNILKSKRDLNKLYYTKPCTHIIHSPFESKHSRNNLELSQPSKRKWSDNISISSQLSVKQGEIFFMKDITKNIEKNFKFNRIERHSEKPKRRVSHTN